MLVIRVMAAFSVVVVAIAAARLAIFWLIVALLVGVLGLVTMNVAGFANELWRSLPLGLVVFVLAIVRCFVAAIAIAIIPIIATARGTAFVGHIPHLVVVSAFNGASLSFISFVVSLFDLRLLLATALFEIVERFKIFRDRLNHLFGKSSSGYDELVTF